MTGKNEIRPHGTISIMKHLTLPKKLLFTLVLFVIAIPFFFDGSPYVFSDAYCYFHTAKTLATEGSFTTTDEPEYMVPAHWCARPYNGKYITIVPPGTALLEAPFLILARPFDYGTQYTEYFKAFNGHSLADGIAVLISGIVYGGFGIFFTFKTLRMLKFSSADSITSVICIGIASYLYPYVFEYPGFPHVYEFFAAAGLLYFVMCATQKDLSTARWKTNLAIGACTGLLVLIRPTDILIAAPLILYSVLEYPCKGFSPLKNIGQLLLAGIPFAAILLLYNYISYGGLFDSGYTEFTSFTKWHLHLGEILFSGVRGWLVYSPAVLFFFIGATLLMKKKVNYLLLTVIPVSLTVLLYSFWPAWWAGHSVGQRFFIVLLPFVAIGFSEFLAWINQQSTLMKRVFIAVITVVTIFSLAIQLLMRITPTQRLYEIIPEFNNSANIPPSEAFTPVDVITYHLHIAKNSNSFQEYAEVLKDGYQGGRSLFLLILDTTEPVLKLENLGEDRFALHIVPDRDNAKDLPVITVEIVHAGRLDVLKLEGLTSNKDQIVVVDCNENGECKTDWNGTEFVRSVAVEGKTDGITITAGDGVRISY